MHIHNRLLIVIGLCLVTVPIGTSLVLLGDLREETHEDLSVALEQAQEGYRKTVSISASDSAATRVADRLRGHITELGAKKLALRKRIAALKATLGDTAYDVAALGDREAEDRKAAVDSRDLLIAFARESYLRRLDSDASTGRMLFRQLSDGTISDQTAMFIADNALTTARGAVIDRLLQTHETLALSQDRLIDTAGAIGEELTLLEDQWDRLSTQYREAEKQYDRAQSQMARSEAQLAEIRRITAEVQSEILRMQGELARIDGRLRAQAERKLIQMGLREDRPDRFTQPSGASATFAWPVDGHVSAGYRDASYQRFFGVPHQAIDIVVPQGTPVRSAAEGIVFLARDGGATGYSYILIGHRDGFATLYGHLSSFAVVAGDTVSQGQIIGLSGATPGTHGAGPMTTGAHLHFETLKNGQHVDPRTVLP